MMTDGEIDDIFEMADALMWAGDIAMLSRKMTEAAELPYEVDRLVSWLTATLPVKSQLESERRTMIELIERHESDNDKILRGLK